MAKSGVKRIDVICPGFNCDGLETLEEINMEVRHAFTVVWWANFQLHSVLERRLGLAIGAV